MKAKKSLGQYFLKSGAAIAEIVRAAEIKKGEKVLEIGPGKGILTAALLSAGAKVTAVEKDSRLVEFLKEKFAPEIKSNHLVLVHDDILKFEPTRYTLQATSYKLVANIPYYLTGEILRKFIGGKVKSSRAVLLVQKEVAERVVARPKPLDSARGKESILSISVKVYGTPKLVRKVPAGAFDPPPKVDSAILLIENIKNNFGSAREEKNFFEILKAGFAHKRKLLAGNLAGKFGRGKVSAAFVKCGLPTKARAENLKLSDWLRLAEFL